jgi:hypothetical protein
MIPHLRHVRPFHLFRPSHGRATQLAKEDWPGHTRLEWREDGKVVDHRAKPGPKPGFGDTKVGPAERGIGTSSGLSQ